MERKKEEGIEDIFKKSKVMQRTPEKMGVRREDIERMFREVGESMRKVIELEVQKVGEKMEEGSEEMRNQIKEIRENWEKERGMMRGRIDELQRRVERLEGREGEMRERGMDGMGGVKRERIMERKLREMVIKIDKEDREERRANIIVKGVKTEGKEGKEVIKELWDQMEIKEEVMEIRKVGGLDRKGKGMILVRLRGVEEERKIMEARKKLRGEKLRVEDDLTGEERRARWKIEKEAEKERRLGKRVGIGYMKIWVDGVMKSSDEIEERWKGEQGNG